MRIRSLLIAAASLFLVPAAMAQDVAGDLPIIGSPKPGGIDFQPAVTKLAADLQWLDGLLVIIMGAITLFVIALLGIVMVRYSRRRNPDPKSFTHNTPVEIAWTVVPIVILVFIGAFSLPILFEQQEIPEGEVTIKATGNQWYWSYEYPDYDLAFDSYMIGSPATGGDNRLTDEVRAQLQEAGYSEDEFKLATDTAMVVPVDTVVVVQVTASDVIHSWTIPAFGVKQDGIPGRLAELWFEATEEGIYFGQCSELCGIAHAYMPITVKVVSQEAYEQWLDGAIDEYGGTPRDAQAVQASAETAAPEGEQGEESEALTDANTAPVEEEPRSGAEVTPGEQGEADEVETVDEAGSDGAAEEAADAPEGGAGAGDPEAAPEQGEGGVGEEVSPEDTAPSVDENADPEAGPVELQPAGADEGGDASEAAAGGDTEMPAAEASGTEGDDAATEEGGETPPAATLGPSSEGADAPAAQ